MTPSNNSSSNVGKISTFIQRLRRQKPTYRSQKDFSILDEQTRSFLVSDKQRLRADFEQAKLANNTKLANSLKRRRATYYIIEDFFLYLVQYGYSTSLISITTQMIKDFIKERSSPIIYLDQASQVTTREHINEHVYDRCKTELNAFFRRVEKDGLISINPMAPLDYTSLKLEPKHLSIQNKADCLAFKEYLEKRVSLNLLSPGTSTRLYNHLLTLLHDAEIRHTVDSSWPVELDDLFADIKWIADWLRNLKNRSICSKSDTLSADSIKLYLLSIRHIYLFLQSQGRVKNDYYSNLKDLFREDGKKMWLPGRNARKINALSEVEEETVFHYINLHSTNSVTKLRDIALFITGIDTTIRVDGLNSMQIENVKELKPGIWNCLVRVKRSSRKSAYSIDQLDDDQREWRDWYMSPRAIEAIDRYLRATDRDWYSKGPIWLTNNRRPISYGGQQAIIRKWLERAGCTFTRPHVLRHTGIDRLINKYNLPIPIVQAISQHADSRTLLKVYAQGSRFNAYQQVNRSLPVAGGDRAKYQKELLSIGTKLNESSAMISGWIQKEANLTPNHTKKVLVILRYQINRLARLLNYEKLPDVIPIPLDDYLQIDLVVKALGLSFKQIFGYEPQSQNRIVVNPRSRKPKSLLHG